MNYANLNLSEETSPVNILLHYLTFLAGGEDTLSQTHFCVCYMDASSKAPIKGFGVKHQTAEEIIATLGSLVDSNGSPATLHVTLNQTNHKGRSKKDIEAPRVFCVDVDVRQPKERVKYIIETLFPHLVVESSPGKYHYYWKCEPSVSLENWSLVQAALAYILYGDLELSETHHMIRVPGVERTCKDGSRFLPDIVYAIPQEEIKPLSYTDVTNIISSQGATLVDCGTQGLEQLRTKRKETAQKARELIKASGGTHSLNQGSSTSSTQGNIGQRDAVNVAALQPGNRNSGLYTCVTEYVHNCQGKINLSEADIIDYAVRLNSAFTEPLDADEVERTALSAYRHAIDAIAAKKQAMLDKLADRGYQDDSDDASDSTTTTTTTTTNQGDADDAGDDSDAGDAPKQAETPTKQELFQYDYSSPVLKKNRFTDFALTERVLQKFKGKLVRAGKNVFAFDSKHLVWRKQGLDNAEIVSKFCASCAVDTLRDPRFIPELCTDTKGQISISKVQQWERYFLSNGTLGKNIPRVLNDSRIPYKALHEFEPNIYQLLCGNGVLDVLSGELRAPIAEDYLINHTEVDYNASAECPEWINFISEVFAENDEPEEMVRFMQDLFGYSLTGSIDAQKIFIHFGAGSNGKSKVLDTLGLLCGGYSARLNGSSLSKAKSGIARDFERLTVKCENKRCVIIDDVDSLTKWNEGMVKNLTSTKLSTRKLYEEERDIFNRSKFHLGCNAAPVPETENWGLLRRLCIIPYPRTFQQSSGKERQIQSFIQGEISGILNWALKGLIRTASQGFELNYPKECLAAVEDYRDENFEVEAFAKSVVTQGDEPRELSDLLKEFNQVVEREFGRGKHLTRPAFGILLKSMGFISNRVNHGKTGRKTYYYVQILRHGQAKEGF